MANERPLLVIREFAPGNSDETRSVRNVEETIESAFRKKQIMIKSMKYIHSPCRESGPKKGRRGLPTP